MTTAVTTAVRRRNLDSCRGGGTCDDSNLSRSEAGAMAATESQRNYVACLMERGYCDHSRLTAAQTASVSAKRR